MYRIRQYSSSDLHRLIELFRSTVRAISHREYSLEQTLAWAPASIDAPQWAERIARNRCWVATIDEVPIGFIELSPEGLIDMLYVHHSHQHEGIGTRLLQELHQAAVAAKLPALHTHSSTTAVPFFELNGFTVDVAEQVTVRGQILATYRMRKVL